MGQPNPADPGATPPATEPSTTPTDPTTPATGDGLGEAGKKALAEERAARKALEAEVKALKERDPVKAIAEALGMKPADAKTDDLTATVKELQRKQAEAELKAARLEVAAVKGLTPAQAARLRGSTRDELEADADELRALFPAAPGTPPPSGIPAPDPTQGPRGSAADLHAAIAAAQEKGDVMEVIRLKSRLLDGAPVKQ